MHMIIDYVAQAQTNTNVYTDTQQTQEINTTSVSDTTENAHNIHVGYNCLTHI